MSTGTDKNAYFLPHAALQSLLDALIAAGYDCVGPQLHDNTIVYRPLQQVDELPRGVRDEQNPGKYGVVQTADDLYFAWANGAQGIKPWVFPGKEILWRGRRKTDGSLVFEESPIVNKQVAIIGARACDIAALYIQDKHFLQADYKDPYYASRRQQLVIIAVNCTHPADTCFCASTGDGPRADYGYDIALTELNDGFVIEAHSQFGVTILQQLPVHTVSQRQVHTASKALEAAAAHQQRGLPSRNLSETLFSRLSHPQWEEIGKRCLSCGNCTSVCPTCFCHCEDEQPALDDSHSEHTREWDSCFTAGHSYIHGITIRASTAQRYRQWLTHKLGSWHEQYGRSGCVGCGRCISWCPVGIDITLETGIICGGDKA